MNLQIQEEPIILHELGKSKGSNNSMNNYVNLISCVQRL